SPASFMTAQAAARPMPGRLRLRPATSATPAPGAFRNIDSRVPRWPWRKMRSSASSRVKFESHLPNMTAVTDRPSVKEAMLGPASITTTLPEKSGKLDPAVPHGRDGCNTHPGFPNQIGENNPSMTLSLSYSEPSHDA